MDFLFFKYFDFQPNRWIWFVKAWKFEGTFGNGYH